MKPQVYPESQEAKSLEEEVPNLKGLGLLKYIGPGLILAMTGIGTSHLVLAPVAGASYGFALLWLLPVAFILKWQGFELAMRYTAATGETVVDAYGRVPGPKNWAVWLVMVIMVVGGIFGLAGMVSAAATVLYAAYGGLSLVLYSFLISAVAIGILLSGRYSGLEIVIKLLAGLLVAVTVLAFVITLPPASGYANFLIPAVPVGATLLMTGLLGWLPTGLELSVWGSLWLKAKGKGMVRVKEIAGEQARESVPEQHRAYVDGWYRTALYDFRLGHIASFLVVSVFLMLGAVVLFPRGVTPEGAETTVVISEIFTSTVGAWMFPVFIAGAFAALFSTFFACYDGYPRAFAAAATRVFPPRRGGWWSERTAWVGLMLVLFVTTILFIGAVPEPVFLVTLASTLSLLIAPVIFGLNLYICRNFISEDQYKPSRPTIWLSIFSILALAVVGVGLTMITLGII